MSDSPTTPPPATSPRRPVVLQVLPALETGGVERGTVEMTAAITRAGGQALVASAGGRLASSVVRAGGRNILLPLVSRSPWRIWRNAAALEAVIRQEKIDLVHARSRGPAWSAWIACQRTGAHFVTTYHGTYNENFPFKRHYNAVMARGEIVIAISNFIARLIQERHGIDPARIRIIPRGVDPAIFDPDAVTSERIIGLARKWRLPDGRPTIMLPGRLTRWKGQGVLIAALAKMQHKDAVVLLVGADQGRDKFSREMASLAESLGVADRVRMVGQCDDMPAAFKLSDVVVNASTDPEAFGRVVIEAQSMARPVIASNHGGAAETVAHDVTGWLVPPDDADALAAALDYVLNLTPEFRAELGAAARAEVARRYTTRAMQDATIAVYRDVLGQDRWG